MLDEVIAAAGREWARQLMHLAREQMLLADLSRARELERLHQVADAEIREEQCVDFDATLRFLNGEDHQEEGL